MIDLHTHSTFSDGSYSPEELICLANEIELKAIALTDHDTIAGIKYAKSKGKELDIEIIHGIEFSTEYNDIEIHILGYFIDIENQGLISLIKDLEKTREERNQKLIKKLNDIGLKIDMDYIKSLSPSGLITKAHFGRAIFEKGYTKTVKDAFNIYLKKGRPAYVSRDLLPYKTAINTIKKANGISVLAHPFLYSFSEKELETSLKILKENGLDGVECYYPSNTSKQTNFILNLANKYNLKVTGGSDFHGLNRPSTSLGKIFLGNPIDYKILENLKL